MAEHSLRDYVRRQVDPDSGMEFWYLDLSVNPPPNRLLRVVVYVLRCYRLAIPWLATAYRALATLLGVTLVTIWGIAGDFDAGQWAAAVAGLFLLLFVVGAYHAWNDAEGDKTVVLRSLFAYQQAEAVRTDYAALREAIGHFLAWGTDLEAVDPEKQSQETVRAMEAWVEKFREFVADAFDMGEHALVLRLVPLDAPLTEQITAAADYLEEILHSRLVSLDVRDGFDAQIWIDAFAAAQEEAEEPEEDQP